MHDMINPEGWRRPRGYSNGVLAAPGRMLFVAGQIGWNTSEEIVSDDFAAQFWQALSNVVEVVKAAGGKPEHVCRLTVYVTDKAEYIEQVKDVGAAYRALMGKHFPAMALVQVAGLVEPRAKVEIEANAVIPTGDET